MSAGISYTPDAHLNDALRRRLNADGGDDWAPGSLLSPP